MKGTTIAERLIVARGAMARKELAKKAKVHEQSIVKWESGKSIPSIENIIKIANACNVSKIGLAFGENQEKDKMMIDEFKVLNEEDKNIILKLITSLNLSKVVQKTRQFG